MYGYIAPLKLYNEALNRNNAVFLPVKELMCPYNKSKKTCFVASALKVHLIYGGFERDSLSIYANRG